MKKYLLTLFSILLTSCLYAQKIEVSVLANSGLFRYAGISTIGNSMVIQASGDNNNYTNNPYSSNNTFSYEFAIQTQYVSKSGVIMGLQTGYDVLKSKQNITGFEPIPVYLFLPIYYNINTPNTPNNNIQASGTTYLQNQFINLGPYIGYRFNLNKVKLDVLPGVDVGFNVNSFDKGKITLYNQYAYDINYKTTAPTDIRLKLGIASSYKRFGVTASYAWGITNYEKDMVGDAVYNAQSRLFRLGLSYRIF